MNGVRPNFKWVIDARADIQSCLFDLYELDKIHRPALLSGDKFLARAYSTMAGAAFSLWRAAFLSDIARGWDEALNAGTQILEEVLTTNAIGFPTEHRRRDWVFGYYLNNAIYRLVAARKVLRIEGEASAAFEELSDSGLFGTAQKPADQWRTVYQELRETLAVLTERTSSVTDTPD
jgi:hypothetical protein